MLNRKINDWIVIQELNTQPKKWLCKCKCGYLKEYTTSYLNTEQVTCCDICRQKNKLIEDEEIIKKYVGSKHGTWTVISYKGKNKHSSRIWLCKCECGLEREFNTSYLSDNSTIRKATICKSCYYKNIEIKNRIVDKIPNRFWDKFCYTCNRRNIPIEITREYAFNVYCNQNKKCIYTGIDLYFTNLRTNFNRYTNASIDRINSSLPYVEGNIQWVYKKINMMKASYSHEEFVSLCKLVAKNN